MEKDYAISMLRFTACLFIFTCHILQYYHLPLAWWFNVGVQIFLILSALLYAQKKITSVPDYLFFRFFRILPAYYVLAFCVTALHIRMFSAPLRANVLSVIFLRAQEISGLDHLWFIPAILICYLFVPFLQKFCDEIRCRESAAVWIVPLLLLVLLSFFQKYAYPVSAFVSAYMLKNLRPDLFTKKTSGKLLFFMIPATAVLILLAVYAATCVNGIAHIFLAYSICLLGFAFSADFPKPVKKALDFSDSYSFDFYLVHHVFILGAFSLLAFHDSPAVMVPAIFLLAVLCALVLHAAGCGLSAIFLKMFGWCLPKRK